MSKLLSARPTAIARRGANSRSWLLIVTPRIDYDLAERVQLFDRHREFFLQQVEQARNACRAAGHINPANVLAAGRGAERSRTSSEFPESKCRKRTAESPCAALRSPRPDVPPILSFSASSKLRSSSFLQRVGVLVAAHRNVAREERRPAADDVDVHHARANVQQRHHLRRIGLVIHFESSSAERRRRCPPPLATLPACASTLVWFRILSFFTATSSTSIWFSVASRS